MNENELQTLREHTSGVFAVACHGGVLVASGSDDFSVKLFTSSDKNIFVLLHALNGHNREVTSVSFSGKGNYLASGSWDATVRVWDVQNGKMTQTLRGHSDVVSAVSFSKDEKLIASGSHDGTIRIWNVDSGETTHLFKGHTFRVFSVAFSVDGKRVVSGAEDCSLRIWDVVDVQDDVQDVDVATLTSIDINNIENRKRSCLVRTLKGHTKFVWSVAFSNDGTRIVSGSKDRTVRLWDVKTGTLLQTLTGHSNVVFSVSFSIDNHYIASGSHDKTIRVWNVATGENVQTLTGHTLPVSSVAFSVYPYLRPSSSSSSPCSSPPSSSSPSSSPSSSKRRNDVDSYSLVSGSWDMTVKTWTFIPRNSISIVRPFPSFIIVGAMKCGTTSLYRYLTQHPSVREGRQKEQHFFDWRWNQVNEYSTSLNMNIDNEEQVHVRKAFQIRGQDSQNPLLHVLGHFFSNSMEELSTHAHLTTGQGSPGYIMGGRRMAERIHQLLPHVKIIIILRDPTARAISHYNMLASRTGRPGQLKKKGMLGKKTFNDFVMEDIASLQSLSFSSRRQEQQEQSDKKSEESRSLPHVLPFDDTAFDEEYLQHLPKDHGCHSFVGRGCYGPLIRLWGSVFQSRQNLHVTTLEKLKGNTQQTMNEIFKFLDLEQHILQNVAAANARKYNAGDIADIQMMETLKNFYQPFNLDLDQTMENFGFDPPNY
jgi:WD40 repeat protein